MKLMSDKRGGGEEKTEKHREMEQREKDREG